MKSIDNFKFIKIIKATYVSLPAHCTDTLQGHNTENSKQIFPEKELCRPQSQFPHSCVLWAIYIFPHRFAYSATGTCVDWSWEYINRSQTHECGNWDWGHATPFLGIRKWDFRYSAQSATYKYFHDTVPLKAQPGPRRFIKYLFRRQDRSHPSCSYPPPTPPPSGRRRRGWAGRGAGQLLLETIATSYSNTKMSSPFVYKAEKNIFLYHSFY